MTEILQAIVLGIVEGLTEFLPISSTGHLIIAEHAIGFKDTAKLFTVVIQMGAIAAVIWYYRKDIWRRITGLFKGSAGDRKFWVNLIIATIPAGLIGLLLENTIEAWAVPSTVAVALILGGFALLWVEMVFMKNAKHRTTNLDDLTYKQSLAIGTIQVLALLPGVSRSGATIVGGLLSGLNRVSATAFSFWLSMPVIILAGSYKLIKDKSELSALPGGSWALLAGTVSAFVSALLVVSWLLRYVAKHDFKPFAYYRIGLGLLLLLMLATGILSNTV